MNVLENGIEDQAAGLRNVSSRQAVAGKASRVRCMAIGSGKGGVGKTVVSVGLSMALSEMGYRVLLFDGDMGLANIDLQMGLDPVHTIQDVIFGNCSLENACIKVPSGPDVLVAASGAPELADLGNARRQMFIEELVGFAAGYDFFIVDTGAGIGRGTTDFLAACPEVLVILANEPTSLMDAYALIKVLRMRESKSSLMTVVNMVDTLDEGERISERLNAITNQFLGIKLQLAGIITYDRRVSHAIRVQQSIINYAERGAVAHCLRELAGKIINNPSRTKRRGVQLEEWLEQWAATDFLGGGKGGEE